MKCPQCLVRNSVAARQCKDCGTKFARKGVPKPLILGGVGVVAVLGLAVAAFSIVPAAFDPETNLQKVAKKVAAGPKSGSDAEHIKAELESTMKDFLEKDSKLSTADLTAKLQKIFPNSAFETRVFDLPHNLRLVEIDTMLQATDYLISGKHVAVLRNFEVFETAKVVPDGVGSDITLLGHRNAQAGHRPQVRVFALLPDGVADRTQESVPPISGDGNAVFATNGKDINLDLSLMSKASEERLFTIETLSKGVLSDETVKSKLTLKNGKYELSEELGKSPFAALRATAFVLADPSAKERFKKYFAEGTLGSATSLGKLKVDPPVFTVKKIGSTKGSASSSNSASFSSSSNSGSSSSDDSSRHSRHHSRHSRHHHHDNDDNRSAPETASSGGKSAQGGVASVSASAVPAASYTFLLNNAQDAFEVAMARRDGRYLVTSVKRVKATNEGSDMVVTKPADDATKSQPPVVDDSSKNSKVVTRVDEFGSKKIVSQDNTDTSSKVTIKEATKDSGSIASKEGDKDKNKSKDRDKAKDKDKDKDKDKSKVALISPSTAPTGEDTESHKQITPKVVEKKADAESGIISNALTTPSIKVRRGASTGYRSVGELKRGAPIQIIGKKDGWYKVQLDGREGYVYGGFVDTKTQDAYATATVRRGKSVKDDRDRTIGEAQTGDRVVVIGPRTNDKYKVQLSSGRTGYLDKDAIDGGADKSADKGNDAPPMVP